MSTATDIVTKFCEAMGRNQKDEILDFFDDESVFENVPMGVVTGSEEIWTFLAPLHEIVTGVEYVVHEIAENDEGSVLTERSDFYHLPDKTMEFRVMGLFKVENGKIRLWRDYFDLKQSMDQLSD